MAEVYGSEGVLERPAEVVPSSIFQVLSQMQTRLSRLEATTNELLTGPWSMQRLALDPIMKQTTSQGQIPPELMDAWACLIRTMVLDRAWPIGTVDASAHIQGQAATYPLVVATLRVGEIELFHTSVNGHGNTTVITPTRITTNPTDLVAFAGIFRETTETSTRTKSTAAIVIRAAASLEEAQTLGTKYAPSELPPYDITIYESSENYDTTVEHDAIVRKIMYEIEMGSPSFPYTYATTNPQK
jgi:hypothetical protein